MIKLIALDLDGTLLTDDKQVSPENKKALQDAVQQGVYVVLCTGRPIMGIQSIIDALELPEHNDYVITFNGGLVQRATTREILAMHPHTLDDVQYIYETLYAHNLPMNAIDLEKVYEPTYPQNNPSLYPVIIKNLTFERREFDSFDPAHTFVKAVCCCPEDRLDCQVSQLPKAFFERMNVFKSRTNLLEIMPKGIDKAFGIAQLCQLLNITMAECMALGDEANDMAMLQAVGYGVAMGNATQHVKAVAKYVTGTNMEHGVAQAIEKFVLNK
ncbi:HAD family phosphatase [Carnobacteriaceae bacterium zg-ZUI252]|nr:HAD family phosphatase [Carnobacteriaceae bacterium zg-ZUI252]